jgi:predicted helicase
VDYLLKTRFDCPNGLADTATVEYEREEESGGKAKKVKAASPRVLILDPACGTGTFLYTVIDHIRHEFMRQGNAGMWSGYVRNHLLPRIFGFELLMAPYAVAHFKLGMQLAGHDMTPGQQEKWAYDFSSDDRLRIYLTNTLEEAERRAQLEFGFFRTLTEEANAAVEVKRDLPILAVIGNPPYSGHSANRSWETQNGKRVPTFIGRLIQDYYKVDGQPLAERNPKYLQDDYVKFIRWAQWRIERTGAGVLAFISNNGYLDNPTFRGMRQQLVTAFTDIYVLNLHGSSKKRETAPDGSKDENVFDIQQGVTLGIFVKEAARAGPARVQHAELYGARKSKYEWLWLSDVGATNWVDLDPKPPFYPFVPQKTTLQEEYGACEGISAAMPVSVAGFKTHRDHFSVGFDPEALSERFSDLRGSPDENLLRGKYELRDTRDWHLSAARETLRSDAQWKRHIIRCMYRPFDIRFCFFSSTAMDWPRKELLGHVAHKENLCFGIGRQGLAVNDPLWSLMCLSAYPIDTNVFRRGGVNVYPLYVYPQVDGEDGGQAKLAVETSPWPAGKQGRRPNLSPEFVAAIEERIGLTFISDGKGDMKRTFGPEDVFNYIYAVLHSPTYRSRYAEFLKSDFPRVPLTSDVKLFGGLCNLGAALVELHLLESPMLQTPIARYPVKGSNIVEKGFPEYVAAAYSIDQPIPDPKECRVYINGPLGSDKAQYFKGVPPEVWEFHIGGYQVCEKWLKDRRGRTLTYDDQLHYCKVVTALAETIRLMTEIDAAIPKWPIA